MGGGVERALQATKRRVRHALQLGVRIDRGARERDWRGQPPPHGSDRTQRNEQQRQWCTKVNRLIPPSVARRLAGRRPSAKSRSGLFPAIVCAEGLMTMR